MSLRWKKVIAEANKIAQLIGTVVQKYHTVIITAFILRR